MARRASASSALPAGARVYGLPVEDYTRLLQAVQEDPLVFVLSAYDWEGLPADRPTQQQTAVLRGVARGERHISIRSGHGTGKSTLLAWLQHWFLLTRRGAVVPATAPSSHQLRDVLWAESARWIDRLLPPWRGQLEWRSDRVLHIEGPEHWFSAARTARRESPDALQGFHAVNLLYLVDEASGVPQEIFEAAEGALSTPGAMVVLAGNPTRVDGYFADSHHKDAAHWALYHFDSRQTPLADPQYAARMAAKYGEDSDVYRVRVAGEFPVQESDNLLSLSVVAAAVGRDIQPAETEPTVFGVDAARFGDDRSVVVVRQGGKVLRLHRRAHADTMVVADWVAGISDAEDPDQICVDSIGVGAGVADRLRQLGYPVVDVNVSERASAKEQFADLRSELWWRVKEWFEAGRASIPDDEDLQAELATIKYRITPGGRVRIESKDERKRRGLGSPDSADALMQSFADDRGAGHRMARENLRRVVKQIRHRPVDAWLGV